jgi:hypothetical protein
VKPFYHTEPLQKKHFDWLKKFELKHLSWNANELNNFFHDFFDAKKFHLCPILYNFFAGKLRSDTRRMEFYLGILTEREESVQLTSSYNLVLICSFSLWRFTFIFYKTTYLNEEVNCTDPFPSISVPWFLPDVHINLQIIKIGKFEWSTFGAMPHPALLTYIRLG